MWNLADGGAAILVSKDVREALATGRPVVALESTVLAHGLPRPRNLEVGIALEEAVRARGGTPATVAVVGGTPRIGLSRAELERVATAPDVLKLSTREIAIAMASGATGATTVASTAFLAARAGIRVFATGGIGGVHRGAPPDVSPDLTELNRTSIVVVCAGAKAILDLPATRERLETLGIPVLGWRTDSFPGFHYRETDLGVDFRVDSADEVAALWRAHTAIGAGGAILVCAPVPEEAAMSREDVETFVEGALDRAEREGRSGKAITPFLLQELASASDGATLEANVALLRNNVEIATGIAEAIAR